MSQCESKLLTQVTNTYEETLRSKCEWLNSTSTINNENVKYIREMLHISYVFIFFGKYVMSKSIGSQTFCLFPFLMLLRLFPTKIYHIFGMHLCLFKHFIYRRTKEYKEVNFPMSDLNSNIEKSLLNVKFLNVEHMNIRL